MNLVDKFICDGYVRRMMMCNSCYSSGATYTLINKIELWANNGLTYTDLECLVRSSAVTYPNTYVFVFKNAIIFNGTARKVYVDVHYVGNKIIPGSPRQAFGGLWVSGVGNQAMKPEQHGGVLLRQLKLELPSHAPKGGVKAVFGDRHGNRPLPNGIIQSNKLI
ncbi:hypothetical protein ACJJJB_00375 [Microbulbifer sp. ANSA001]|uniref:hypothetical protein n=1 Tax=Microbulbifer sp. ANSA001 TaxID=3243358 RepID=UPI00404269BA